MSGGAAGLDPAALIGTWRLISSIREEMATGKKTPAPAGTTGYLVITPGGRFMVVIARGDRRPAKTEAEHAALQQSHLAYTGRFTLGPNPHDPQGLTLTNRIDVSWNAAWTGGDQIRHLSLSGNRLTVTTDPTPGPYDGVPQRGNLVWERAE